MDAADNIALEFLAQRGLKITAGRRAIIREIIAFGRPFEAEELLLNLRRHPERVSKATVYRTLKHLVDGGLINQVFFGPAKQSYYDFAGSGTAPAHLVDVQSGKIIEFTDPEVVELSRKIASRLGYRYVSHRFLILGTPDQTEDDS
jgi:Fur family ferric uptake transcriptional regulator